MNTERSILIVEDEPLIQETLRFALEFEGYQVSAASNGREALEALTTTPRPALILLDLMMPTMDGWGFLEAQAQDARIAGIPVVLLTAFDEHDRKLAGKDVIQKPVELEALLKAIEKYCPRDQPVAP